MINFIINSIMKVDATYWYIALICMSVYFVIAIIILTITFIHDVITKWLPKKNTEQLVIIYNNE